MDDDFFIDSNAGFKIRYGFDYYTPQRIKRILKKDFNCRLENVWQGYKANRWPGYHEIYNLVDDATGEIVGKELPLDHFRKEFARMGYPLHDEKSNIHKGCPKRNKGAEDFMQLVNRVKKEGR